MPREFRVVVDTNTLISSLIARGNEYELLQRASEGRIKLVVSFEILKEMKEVLSRPKFGFSGERIEQFIVYLLGISEIVIPLERISVIKDDPDDDKIIECAVAGGADYIVSGDKHLLSLKKFKKIPIVRTSEMLRILSN